MKIVSHAAYLPAYRVSRAEIAAFADARDTGERICAGGDEDSTTMAVAAGRRALEGTAAPVTAIVLATSTPVYADKSNASTVVCALGLDRTTMALDVGPSVRSGAAALATAAKTGGLAIVSDLRQGHTGSVAERRSGDCAAAVLFAADGPGIAEVIGMSSQTLEVLDRWRAPGAAFGRAWEERFGESVYLQLVGDILAWAKTVADEGPISQLAVTSPNPRVAGSASRALRDGLGVHAPTLDLADVGDAGAASPGIALSRALDAAAPGELILVTSLADGYDALLVRKSAPAVSRAQTSATVTAPYSRYLRWRERFASEPQRRPDPVRVSAPYASRNADFKFAFIGGRCSDCGRVQFPSPLVCLTCGGAGPFERVRGADSRGTVVTFTVDRLAMTLDPPLVSAVIELDAGGRVQLEMTEVGPAGLAPSTRVELVFRRLGAVDGIVNYFWKARPIGTELLMAIHSIADQVAIIGMGCTRFAEHFDRSADELMLEAMDAACAEASIGDLRDIDAFWIGTYISGISGMSLTRPIRLRGKPVTRVENMCATGSEALRAACYAVACGAVDVAMAVGVEKLKDGGFSGLASPRIQDDGTRSAITAPANFSLVPPAYEVKYGVDEARFRKSMTHIAQKNHANGALNPRAQYQRPVSEETVERSALVAGQLRVMDCSGVSDGAAAAIVVPAARAREYVSDPLYVKALSVVTGYGAGAADPEYDYTTFPEVVASAAEAYRQAGIVSPGSELAMAEVHDCFTSTEIVLMEDLGLSPRGQAWQDVLDGRFDRTGDLPVNADGGLKSFGHPVGASGLRMIFECWTQLRGRAGERQVATAHRGLALTQNLGGAPGDCVSFVSVVGTRPAR